MTDDELPIAWRALKPGTPVYSSDGEQLGKLSHVVADDAKDIFSGIAFQRGMLGDERFAPAPLVDQITTDGVHLNVPHGEVDDKLQPYGH